MTELAGNTVSLTNFKTSDVLQSIAWSISSPESFFLLNSVLPLTSEDLVLELNTPDRDLYLINDKKGARQGLLRIYNINKINKRALLALTLLPSGNNAKILQEAGELAIEKLFSKDGITKIYAHALSYEQEYKLILNKLLFKKEGTLKEHFYFDNKYLDVEIFGLAKEDYFK